MSYEQMANVYDLFMADAPYEKWVTFTEETIQSAGRPIKRIADLGCGTGEITTRLAKNGYSLVGIDYSEEMLTIAEQKSTESNMTIDWLHQDIRELDGLSGFDAAISYCDVINYLTKPEDVKQTFQQVYQLLNPGGLFIFDVHHLPYISNHYMNETFAEVTDDASYIWFCSPGEEIGEMYHDLTFFYLSNGIYVRFDEQHHQRTFSQNFYKEILASSGFENVKVYGDFNPNLKILDDNTARIFFCATKESR